MSTFTTNLTLLSNASETGLPATVDCGGLFLLSGVGTFGGATASVQILGPDGATYIDLPGATLTAAGAVTFFLPDNAVIKGALTGGAPSAIYLSVRRVPQH